MRIEFSKYEALGNDFIVIDESQDEKQGQMPRTSIELRQLMCDRKRGIGADGVITLLPPETSSHDVFMHVTNSDGSIPENCGNGLRCVAKYWKDSGRVFEDQDFVIETLSGQKRARVSKSTIEVEVGTAKVQVRNPESAVDSLCEDFAKKHNTKRPQVLAFVDIGNPHLIVECKEIDDARVELGPRLEKIFANGANVSFVNVKSDHEVLIRTWERGAGATDACGSGASASVAALKALGRLPVPGAVKTYFANGVLEVLTQSESTFEYKVNLSGPAQRLFAGVWERTLLS